MEWESQVVRKFLLNLFIFLSKATRTGRYSKDRART